MKGTIILVENTSGGILSKLIKFFTRRIAKKYDIPTYTHVMLEVGDICGERSVLSAEELMAVMPLSRFEKSAYKVYEIQDKAPEEWIDSVIRDMYRTTAGNGYGFLQLFWFVYRWFMELFNVDVRKQKNWFPLGDICSEQGYRYIWNRMFKRLDYDNVRLLRYMNQWNENTISPVDIGVIVKEFPETFKLMEVHNFTENKDDILNREIHRDLVNKIVNKNSNTKHRSLETIGTKGVTEIEN